MSAFQDFREAVLTGAAGLAKDLLKTGVQEARTDAADFLNDTKEKLKRWARLRADGKITDDEFSFLVGSQKDLADLLALTKLGVGLARLQEFRNKLIDLVIEKAFAILIP
jgi:hypothetical protein